MGDKLKLHELGGANHPSHPYAKEHLMTQPNEHLFSNGMKIGKRAKVTVTEHGGLLPHAPGEFDYFIESPLTKGAAIDWKATALFLVKEYEAHSALVHELSSQTFRLLHKNEEAAVTARAARGEATFNHITLSYIAACWPYKFLPRWLREDIQTALGDS